ncbi:MAG: phage minor capsid protein, partial [Oscillospiraceae bacterium]|nr:phage minor capsid protein [Oscillospiraceae bacterium]
MTTLEQMNLSQPLTDVYTAMETDLMMAIARQLAEGGEISATSEWRLKKLAEAGALSKETVRIIASYTGIQSDLITEAIEGAAMGIVDRLEPALQACAKDGYISAVSGTPISESMKNVVTNFRKQAKTDLNLVNTVMQYKAGSAYKNLVNKIYDDTKREELLGVLGKHTLEVASDGTSRQEAVRNCIKEFSQKGIPAFVDKRGREWSPEAYINMDIRTTVHNTANAAQDACCDKYGLDLILISSHMGARPKCAMDQGKLYSRSDRSGVAHDGDGNPITFYPWSSSSYGQPDGILGINCHHHKYPFVDGVNFQRYFPYDKDENEERYKEFQKQRAMERRVRETSRQADMLEAAGDTEGAKAARRQLREQRKAYRE